MSGSGVVRSVRLLVGGSLRCPPALAQTCKSSLQRLVVYRSQSDDSTATVYNTPIMLYCCSSPVREPGGLSAGAQRGPPRRRQPDLHEQEPPQPGADGPGYEGPGLEDHLAPAAVLPQVYQHFWFWPS